MNHSASVMKNTLGGLGLFLAAALLFLCLSGCSGEVYNPGGETLFLDGDGTAGPETGDVLEIPAEDPFAQSPHVLRVDFLDTGKSDAILIRADDAVILVDTGEADDYSRISQKLGELGITDIDYLILTHFDNDHIGSAAGILQNFSVGRVYMPHYVRDSNLYRRMMAMLEVLPGTECLRVTEATTLEIPYGNLRITPTELYEPGLTLGSDGDHAAEENNYSLITELSFGEKALLFLGDAEQDRLAEFLEDAGDTCAYDLIKIPHHGSYDKALGELLRRDAVLRYCVVHAQGPDEVEASLVTAMRSAGAAAYYTYDGDVAFSTDGKNMLMAQEASP